MKEITVEKLSEKAKRVTLSAAAMIRRDDWQTAIMDLEVALKTAREVQDLIRLKHQRLDEFFMIPKPPGRT